MSEVVLSKSELEGGQLPLVCICSGEPVESLTEIAIAPTKIPQLAGLPTGYLSKDLLTKLFGSALGAKVGRGDGAKNKQTIVMAVRILLTLGLFYNAFSAVSGGNLMGILISMVGLVVVIFGGTWVNRALTVGVVSDGTGARVTGAHPNFVEALEAMRSGVAPEKQLVRTGPAPKPVPAPGLY